MKTNHCPLVMILCIQISHHVQLHTIHNRGIVSAYDTDVIEHQSTVQLFVTAQPPTKQSANDATANSLSNNVSQVSNGSNVPFFLGVSAGVSCTLLALVVCLVYTLKKLIPVVREMLTRSLEIADRVIRLNDIEMPVVTGERVSPDNGLQTADLIQLYGSEQSNVNMVEIMPIDDGYSPSTSSSSIYADASEHAVSILP